MIGYSVVEKHNKKQWVTYPFGYVTDHCTVGKDLYGFVNLYDRYAEELISDSVIINFTEYYKSISEMLKMNIANKSYDKYLVNSFGQMIRVGDTVRVFYRPKFYDKFTQLFITNVIDIVNDDNIITVSTNSFEVKDIVIRKDFDKTDFKQCINSSVSFIELFEDMNSFTRVNKSKDKNDCEAWGILS